MFLKNLKNNPTDALRTELNDITMEQVDEVTLLKQLSGQISWSDYRSTCNLH